MKVNYLILIATSSIFISNHAWAMLGKSNNQKSTSKQLTGHCEADFRLKSSDFESKYAGSFNALYANKYCILNKKYARLLDKALLPELKEVGEVTRRYNEVYSSYLNKKKEVSLAEDILTIEEKKLAFLDLFLRKASLQYRISLRYYDWEGDESSIGLTFNSMGVNGKRRSGYGIILSKEDVNALANVDAHKYMASPDRTYFTDRSDTIIDQVNYILGHVPLDSIDKYNPKTTNKALQLHSRTITSTGVGEEDDTDICDADCRNDEYEGWAEEQAEGWADYLDHDWMDDEDNDERYLLIETEDGFHEAYHYNPE